MRDAYDAGRDHFSSFSKASHPIKSEKIFAACV